uniref:3-hydroxyisobutyrate dehydrogenase n=2 Tax=Rhodnius prolixus TaxID=13249 RepID=R4FKE4_RHOPR
MFMLRTIRLNNCHARFFSTEANQKISSIGFVGLGNMGFRMCKNLIKKGFDVTVYDKSKESLTQFEKEGAKCADDPRKLVSSVDCVITMIPTGADVMSLYTPQVISSFKPRSLVIDSSTVEHTVAQDLEGKFKEVGVSFIDAPVSGGILAAESGTLTFMVGGDTKVMNRAEPVLKAMGTTLYHCGGIGSGQVAKVCNNLILGVTMAGLCEALAIGVALGLDPKVLTEVINASSGQCWSSSKYNPVPGILPIVPSSHEYKAGFAAQMILKDLGIANKAGKNLGLALEIGKKTFEMYDAMCKSGLNEKDFSVIYNYVSKRTK